MPTAKNLAARPLALALTPALLLAACGHGGKGSDAASAENVEMPAEEAMRGLDANATPAPDAEATAQASDAPEPAAVPAGPAAPKATASSSPKPAASPIRM